MAAIQQRQSSLGDIQSLLDIFKGKSQTTSNTTTTGETVSDEKTKAIIDQILQGPQGIAALGTAQRGTGLYNSSTNQLLNNDLLARASAQAALASTTKTTTQTQTQKQNPQLNPLATIGGFASQYALKTGAKKLGIKTPDEYLTQGISDFSNTFFPGSVVGVDSIGADAGLSSFYSAPINTAGLQDLGFLDSLVAGDASGAEAAAGAPEIGLDENTLFGDESGYGGSEGSAGLGAGGSAALGAGAAAGIGAAIGGSSAAGGAAAGGYAIAAGDTAFGLGAGSAAAGAAEGAGLWEGIVTAIAAWIVCTELYKQGRLPYKWYRWGAREFAKYDERGKQGYYIWAVPAVKHLRAHPYSLRSRLLCAVFNSRAQYLAAKAGCNGAKKTAMGWFLTHSLYTGCWILSRTIARKPIDWSAVYSKGN